MDDVTYVIHEQKWYLIPGMYPGKIMCLYVSKSGLNQQGYTKTCINYPKLFFIYVVDLVAKNYLLFFFKWNNLGAMLLLNISSNTLWSKKLKNFLFIQMTS